MCFLDAAGGAGNKLTCALAAYWTISFAGGNIGGNRV
jgi:hypothetical protein